MNNEKKMYELCSSLALYASTEINRQLEMLASGDPSYSEVHLKSLVQTRNALHEMSTVLHQRVSQPSLPITEGPAVTHSRQISLVTADASVDIPDERKPTGKLLAQSVEEPVESTNVHEGRWKNTSVLARVRYATFKVLAENTISGNHMQRPDAMRRIKEVLISEKAWESELQKPYARLRQPRYYSYADRVWGFVREKEWNASGVSNGKAWMLNAKGLKEVERLLTLQDNELSLNPDS